MPTVPRITPQVSPTPLPNARRSARLTPLAAGVGLAQAQGNVGDAMTSAGISVGIATARLEAARVEAAEKARNAANKAAAMRLKNRADEFIRKALYTPGTGYLYQQGQNALKLPEQAQADMRAFMAEIDPQVANPDQRLAWEEISANMQDEVMLSVYRHTGGEQHKVITQEYTTGIANAQALGGAAANDPRAMANHMADGLGTIDALAKHEGWGPTTIDDAKFKFKSNTLTTAIHNLIAAKETDKAKAMFAEAKAAHALDGDQQAELEKTLTASNAQKKAYALFDKLDKSGMSPGDQRKWIAANETDPDVRELAEQLVMHEIAADRTTEGVAVESRDLRITQLLLKNPSLTAIPAADVITFKSGELTHWFSVIDNIKNSAPGQESPYPKVSKPSVMAYLIDLAQRDPVLFTAYPDKDGKNGLNLAAPNYIASLSKEDHEQVLRLQASMRAGNQKQANEIAAGPFSFNDVWTTQLAAHDMKPNDPRAAEIMTKVQQDGQFAAMQKKDRTPLTPAEWEPIIKRNLVAHVIRERSILPNETIQGYLLTFQHIPVELRESIKEAIENIEGAQKVRNMSTDPRMVTVYRRYLADQAERRKALGR